MPLPENIFILFYWTAPESSLFFDGEKGAIRFWLQREGENKRNILMVLVLGLFVLFYKVNGGVQEESKDSTNTVAEGG
mgnify:FL=1